MPQENEVPLPSAMRALQWSTPSRGLERDLTLRSDTALPKNAETLPKGCTLVRVAYTTLNPADYKLPEIPFIGGRLPTKIPCLDFSGTVVRTTRSDLRPGQKVFGKTEPPHFGALAEYLVVGEQGCVAMPDGLNIEDAATIGVTGLTAYQSLVGRLKCGEKLLINGASGGTGCWAVQIAKLQGLHVTAVCSGANAEFCKSLGADEVIDYRTVDGGLVQHLVRRGNQYDMILDLVFADSDLYWQCHHYLKEDAPFVTIVGTASFQYLKAVLAIRLIPSWLGGGKRRFDFVLCSTNARQLAQIAQWVADGKIEAVVERTLEMDEVPEGFARLKSGRTRGKITVRIGDH